MSVLVQIKESKVDLFGYRGMHLYEMRKDSTFKEQKRRLFQLITDHQYLDSSLPFKKREVVLMCTKADNFGDVKHTFLCAELIEKKWPGSPISVVINCLESEEIEKVKKIFPVSHFKTRFLSSCDHHKREKELIEIRETAGCLLGVAVPINSPELKGPVYRMIREYGFSFHPDCKKNHLAMGLMKSEEGILFPSMPSRTLVDMRTEWLKMALAIHSAEDERKYAQERKLYHMYMPKWTLQMVALYSIALVEKQNSHAIDVFLPLCGSLKQLIEWGALKLEVLQKSHIGRLVCVSSEGTECMELGEGKEMRILRGIISQEDMEAIQQHSQPFFGCTGDASVSAAIALNKWPLYADPGHKGQFVRSWIEIASKIHCEQFVEFQKIIQAQSKKESDVYEAHTPKLPWWAPPPSYALANPLSIPRSSMPSLSLELPDYAEKIAGYYQSSQLQEEMTRVNAHIKENFNFETRLMAMVNRGLILTNYPELVHLEKSLWKGFKTGEITEEELVEQLHRSIERLEVS